VASLATSYVTVALNTTNLTAGAGTAGTVAGQVYGTQFQRAADGRLRDMHGRFVSESVLAGRRSGDGFGRGFSGGLGGIPNLFRPIALGIAGIAGAAQNLLPIIGQLVTASGALAAALPAAITAGIAVAVTFKLALVGVGDAVKAAFDPSKPEAFNEALKKLAPSARAFVTEIAASRSVLTGVQQAIQQQFFLPLVGGFQQLVKSRFFDVVKTQLGGIALDAGKAARGILDVVTEATKANQISAILDPIGNIFADMAKQVPGLARSFLTLAAAAMPFIEALSGALVTGLAEFNALVRDAAASGALQRLFQTGLEILKDLGALLVNVASIFKSLFEGISAGGGPTLGLLSALTGQLAAFLKTAEAQSALASFGQLLHAVGTIVSEVLAALLPVAGALIKALAGPLALALERIAPLIGQVGDILIATLLPVFKSLQPVIDTVVRVLADFLVAALSAVATHMTTMAPIARDLAARLGPQLVPLVEALGKALQAIVPIIPAISQAIIAMIPILLKLLPVFEFLIKVTTALWTGIAWAVENIVVPAFDFFAKVAVTSIKVIAGIFTWLYDLLIGNSIIPDLVNGMISWFQRGMQTATTIFQALRAAIVTIFAAIQAVWNAWLAFFRDVILAGIQNVITLAIGGYQRLRDNVASIFGTIRATLESGWAFIRDRVFQPLINAVTVTLPDAFRRGASLIGQMFSAVQGAVAAPINWVIENVINRVIGIWNDLAGKLGVKGATIGAIRSLNAPSGAGARVMFRRDGGLVGPPGFADGGFPYAAAAMSRPGLIRGPGGPREDRVPLWASAKEFIVNAAATAKWMPLLEAINNDGSPRYAMPDAGHQHFANGGLPRFAAGGFVGDLVAVFSDPAKWIRDRVGGALNSVPGAGAARELAVGFGRKVVDAVAEWAKSKLFVAGGATPGFPPWPSAQPGRGGPRGDSGVWRSIVALIRSTGPVSGSFGNGYRPGDPLWHGAGRAVDWMGFNQDALAMFLAARRPLELIHRTRNRDYAYTRGVNKGSFNQGLMEAHRNHIHIAMQNGGVIKEPVFGLGRSGRSYSFGEGGPETVTPANTMAELVTLLERLIAAVERVAPGVAGAMLGGVGQARQLARAR
jgi:phage-related protein